MLLFVVSRIITQEKKIEPLLHFVEAKRYLKRMTILPTVSPWPAYLPACSPCSTSKTFSMTGCSCPWLTRCVISFKTDREMTAEPKTAVPLVKANLVRSQAEYRAPRRMPKRSEAGGDATVDTASPPGRQNGRQDSCRKEPTVLTTRSNLYGREASRA